MQVFGRSEDGTGDAVQDHEVSPTATPADTGADHKAILKFAFNGIPGGSAGLHAYEVVRAGQSFVQYRLHCTPRAPAWCNIADSIHRWPLCIVSMG